jgi:NAD(P)H-flavin reductase
MPVSGESTDATLPQSVKIAEVVRETNDTYTLTAVADDGRSLPCFLPGQFSMVYEYGAGEVPISISGDCEVRDRLVYTIRAVGKATAAIVSHRPGDYIAVRSSFGTSWPVDLARGQDVLLVAGGIGLAPLRPVISYVMRHRPEYGRLVLLYGARTPKDLLFRREFRRWREMPRCQALITVDRPAEKWRGQVGLVTKLFDLVSLDPSRTVAMTCGPETMMQFVVRELLNRKFDPARIFLSMERNMKCGIGLCGHCQMGPYFVCKDGPILAYSQLAQWMENHDEL